MADFKAPKFNPVSLGGNYGGITDALNAAFKSTVNRERQEAITRGEDKASLLIKQSPGQLHNLEQYKQQDPIGSVERKAIYKRLRAANEATLTGRVEADVARAQDLIQNATNNDERAEAFGQFENAIVGHLNNADADTITRLQPYITRSQEQLAILSENQYRKQVKRETSITVIGNLNKDSEVGFSEDNPGSYERLLDAHKNRFITTAQFLAFRDKGIAATISTDNVAPLFSLNAKPQDVFDPKNDNGIFKVYKKLTANLMKQGVDPKIIPDKLNDWINEATIQFGAAAAEEYRDLIEGSATLDEALGIVYGETEQMFQGIRDSVYEVTKDQVIANTAEKQVRGIFRDKTAAILRRLEYQDKAAKAGASSALKNAMVETVRTLDGNLLTVSEGGELSINLVTPDQIHQILNNGTEAQIKKATAGATIYEDLVGAGNTETLEESLEFLSQWTSGWLEDPDNADKGMDDLGADLKSQFGLKPATVTALTDSFGNMVGGAVQQLPSILQGETRPQVKPNAIRMSLGTETQGIPTQDNQKANAVMEKIPDIYEQISGGDSRIKMNAKQADAILASLGTDDFPTYMSAIEQLAPITTGNQKINILSFLNSAVDLVDSDGNAEGNKIPTKDNISQVSRRVKQDTIETTVKGKEAYTAHLAFALANTEKTGDVGKLNDDRLGDIIEDVNDSNVVQFGNSLSDWWYDDTGGVKIYVPNIPDSNGDTIDKETSAVLIMATVLRKQRRAKGMNYERLLETAEELLDNGAYFEAQADGSFHVFSSVGTEVPEKNRTGFVVRRDEVVELYEIQPEDIKDALP